MAYDPAEAGLQASREDAARARMRVHFDTSEYEIAHGSKPKGFGRWAFEFANDDGWLLASNGEKEIVWAPNSMKFSEAKRWATKKARELNANLASVCP